MSSLFNHAFIPLVLLLLFSENYENSFFIQVEIAFTNNVFLPTLKSGFSSAIPL